MRLPTSWIPGIGSDIIFKRITKWIGINYASFAVVLHYEDNEQGKLIAKGWRPMAIRRVGRNFWGAPKGEAIDAPKYYYTSMNTVKFEKLKVEYGSIEYGSYYLSTTTNTYLTSK